VDGLCFPIGPGGAGHYVKMVHNGIEYGDMQLIAEAYDLRMVRDSITNSCTRFLEWNTTDELNSFLIEITADIFNYIDPETMPWSMLFSMPLAGEPLDGAECLELGVYSDNGG